jgi:hypothetical protein
LATDDAGQFQFTGLPADTHELTFEAPGFQGRKLIHTLAANESAALSNIVLQVGGLDICPDFAEWERPKIKLRAIHSGVELTGKAEQVRPALRKAVVILTTKRRSYKTSTSVGPDGSFHFSGIQVDL